MIAIVTLAGAPVLHSVAPAQSLPRLGDGLAMTLAEERLLGESIARELYRDPDYVDDPLIQEYVDDTWRRLRAAARTRGDIDSELDQRLAWTVLMGRDASVNAFALPGGWLGLHMGLVAVSTSRDELAAVLAHELTHVSQRHLARLLAQQKQQAPLLLGSIILAAIVASKSPDAAQAIAAGGTSLVSRNALAFSRDMEREADRIGFGVLQTARFDGNGFATLFDKLERANSLMDNGSFPYLRSHPLTTERVADARARLHDSRAQSFDRSDAMVHALLAARARVLTRPGVEALRALSAAGDVPPRDVAGESAAARQQRRAATLYAAVLADGALRVAPSVSAKRWTALASLVQGQGEAERIVRLSRAEALLAQGDAAQAVSLMGTSPVTNPTQRRPEVLLRAQAALTQAGARAGAVDGLQTWVATHPRDPQAWRALSNLYAVQAQSLRALHAEAESQAAQLDWRGAVDRYTAAQRWAQANAANLSAADQMDLSIIDTRMRAARVALREQQEIKLP